MKITLARFLCKHAFPIQPPHGSILRPGDCTGCGITYAERERELDAAAAAYRAGTAHRGYCPRCRQNDRMLFIFIQEPRPWDCSEPRVFLCGPCWSATTLEEEKAIENGALFSITDLRIRAKKHAQALRDAAEQQKTGPGPFTLNGGVQPELPAA